MVPKSVRRKTWGHELVRMQLCPFHGPLSLCLTQALLGLFHALPRAQISLTPQKTDLARTAEKQGEFV